MTLSVASVLSKVKKQITIFLFQLRWKSHIFPFFGLFQEWIIEWRHIFLGAPLSRSQMDFVFYTFSTFWMRSWRNAWHQLYQSRKTSAKWRAETDLYIDAVVSELYVIKSWWIIKFSNGNIHQLVFSLSTRVLNNLNKLYLVVTELFFRN